MTGCHNIDSTRSTHCYRFHPSHSLRQTGHNYTEHMSAGAELCVAAFKGDLIKVKAIVAARPAATVQVVNSVNGPEFQSTALMWASDRGHKDIAEFLISNGANVDAKNKYGYTALMMASVNDKKDMVELLISRGANINASDEDKTTALMLATERGRATIVQVLLERGADVNLHDEVSLPILLNLSNDLR